MPERAAWRAGKPCKRGHLWMAAKVDADGVRYRECSSCPEIALVVDLRTDRGSDA